MPMKPGTKPNPRHWMEVPIHKLQHVLRKHAAEQKTSTTERTLHSTYQVFALATHPKEVIARIYTHRKSQQCLISTTITHLLPKDHDEEQTKKQAA